MNLLGSAGNISQNSDYRSQSSHLEISFFAFIIALLVSMLINPSGFYADQPRLMPLSFPHCLLLKHQSLDFLGLLSHFHNGFRADSAFQRWYFSWLELCRIPEYMKTSSSSLPLCISFYILYLQTGPLWTQQHLC